MKKVLLLSLLTISLASVKLDAQITSIASGNWSDIATWGGGVVPGANDDVVVSAGNTVTIDVSNAVCKNISIDGTLSFPDADAKAIIINGNVLIGATGKFNTFVTGAPAALRNQSINIKGNLTVAAGGNFDMRRGSNPNVSIGTVEFSGTTNSEITLSQTVYGSSIEEFNGIIINKTGGAKVILKAGNLFMSNNTSTGPTILTFTSGIIETEGTSIWGYLTTNTVGIVGASSTNHVKGNLGRGMSNSAGTTRIFYVGDTQAYRPVVVRSSTAQGATGAMIIVTSILGNANNSSTFVGGIDKVSEVRYFKVTYFRGASGATTLTLDSMAVSYGVGDGVAAGNINLRLAYSTNNRATWTAVQQTTPYVTTITDTSRVGGDPLNPGIVISDGQTIYLALARVTGTTENCLCAAVDVEDETQIPAAFSLEQNYPNPFNPTTMIKFSLLESSPVHISVYNLLGEKVMTVVDKFYTVGTHEVRFNASSLESGIYFYRITTNDFVQTKKMTLIK